MSATAGLIVVAAGTGTRLGAAVHKALVELSGRALVEHTLRRLLTLPQLKPVVLVGHPDDRPALQRMLAGLPTSVQLVDGGARRQDSVAAGLAAIGESCDIVLVHDAARPFVPLETIEPLIAAAREHGCALLAVPVADTLKRARDDDAAGVDCTISRSGLWAAQTPQAFDRARLVERLADAQASGTSVTDEAGLFEAAGLPVRFVEGSTLNIKLTTAADLELARALLPRFVTEGDA